MKFLKFQILTLLELRGIDFRKFVLKFRKSFCNVQGDRACFFGHLQRIFAFSTHTVPNLDLFEDLIFDSSNSEEYISENFVQRLSSPFYKLGTITRARAVILRLNLRGELIRLNFTQFLKVTSNL